MLALVRVGPLEIFFCKTQAFEKSIQNAHRVISMDLNPFRPKTGGVFDAVQNP